MTLDKTMELAREAGCIKEDWLEVNEEFMQRFATIVADREREACAKACEEVLAVYVDNSNKDQAAPLLRECAANIRARGGKGENAE